ncbi:MAG: hypothetical protein Q8L41_05190 [Anaerolineales bacterium]|nr:hypothetical protein [Anaerolineales bacterium]MDP2777498.1 hypothetical protein [Anaerolineales bacterium]
MNAEHLPATLGKELKRRKYFVRMDILDQTASLVKIRLYVTPDLFVQIYRNDRYQTTNLVLIHNNQRLYARDKLDGRWHRHTHLAPEEHDASKEGQRPVEVSEFLDEVEKVIAALDLP